MLVAGAAEAAYGAVQFVTGSGPGAFELSGRAARLRPLRSAQPVRGLSDDDPAAGRVHGVVSREPGALSLARRWRRRRLLVVGIGLSQSRGAWLGAAVPRVTLLLAWSRSTRRLLIPCALVGACALALAVSGVLPPAILDRLSQTIQYFGVFDVRTVEVTSDNWAIVERMAHWQAGWYMFLDHPWLGVGAGNYAQAYPDYLRGHVGGAAGPRAQLLPEHAGRAGRCRRRLAAAAAGHCVSPAGRRRWCASERRVDSFWRAVLAGAFGGLVVFCVHNMFDSLFVHSVNIQIGVLLGLGAGWQSIA